MDDKRIKEVMTQVKKRELTPGKVQSATKTKKVEEAVEDLKNKDPDKLTKREEDLLVAEKVVRTPKDKTLEVLREGRTSMWKIQYKEGGNLPKKLQGLFTSQDFANTAVKLHLASI